MLSYRQFSQGAGAWLGLVDQDQTDASANDIWFQRRAAYHGKSLLMGRGVSQKCKDKLESAEDHVPTPTPRDPLHVRGSYVFVCCLLPFYTSIM